MLLFSFSMHTPYASADPLCSALFSLFLCIYRRDGKISLPLKPLHCKTLLPFSTFELCYSLILSRAKRERQKNYASDYTLVYLYFGSFSRFSPLSSSLSPTHTLVQCLIRRFESIRLCEQWADEEKKNVGRKTNVIKIHCRRYLNTCRFVFGWVLARQADETLSCHSLSIERTQLFKSLNWCLPQHSRESNILRVSLFFFSFCRFFHLHSHVLVLLRCFC